jgi:DNA-binding NtrC family response regulator
MAAASSILEWNKAGRVLIASSRVEFRERLAKGLVGRKTSASVAAGGADALMKLEGSEFRTLLLDSKLEDLDVGELVETIRGRYPQLNVIVMDREKESEQLSFELTDCPDFGKGDRGSALEEAASFLWDDQIGALPGTSEEPTPRMEALPGMIGTSRKMHQIYRLSRLVAPRDTVVLIVGATGTGKELVARGIHQLSRRSRGPFVVVNCAAIPESLLEAELFGFTRGAFTGAFQSRLGRIHAAHGGTLLLDEVGELPLSMQAKLLRFVQEGEVQRLGSADLFRVDTRLMAATNADLLQRVREKQFREDLYYRLAVFPLDLPPLRHRSEDILPLARHFLESLCRQSGSPQKEFSPEAANLLRKHSWPGNVRELQHWVERAFVLADTNFRIQPEDLLMPTAAA